MMSWDDVKDKANDLKKDAEDKFNEAENEFHEKKGEAEGYAKAKEEESQDDENK